MITRDMHKEMGLFYIVFLTVTLYIQWDQFIIVQVTLTTPSHQVPSNFRLDFKILHLNLLKNVTLLTLKIILGDHPARFKIIMTIFKYKWLNSNLKETRILLSQLSMPYQKKIYQLIHQRFGHISIDRLKRMARKGPMKGVPTKIPEL